MFAAWPILKFLFRVVAPTIPEIVSTISKMKNQEGEPHSHQQDFKHRVADLDRRLAMQLDLIDTLTTQLAALQLIVRRAHIIGIMALALAVIAIAMFLFLP